jgi:hypothetical protein
VEADAGLVCQARHGLRAAKFLSDDILLPLRQSDASGRITFLGILSDGTKATQKVPISQNGDWPLYVGLYGGKGSLLGWTSVTNHEDGDLNGILSWSKAAAAGKLYANGFTNNATLTGSRYTRPNSGRVLNLINGFVTFTGGDLSAPFTNHVTLTEDNRFANLSTNKLTLSITPATGLFAGIGTDPATGKSIPFKGAVLRKQNRASGHFLGPTQSGRVSVDP